MVIAKLGYRRSCHCRDDVTADRAENCCSTAAGTACVGDHLEGAVAEADSAPVATSLLFARHRIPLLLADHSNAATLSLLHRDDNSATSAVDSVDGSSRCLVCWRSDCQRRETPVLCYHLLELLRDANADFATVLQTWFRLLRSHNVPQNLRFLVPYILYYIIPFSFCFPGTEEQGAFLAINSCVTYAIQQQHNTATCHLNQQTQSIIH